LLILDCVLLHHSKSETVLVLTLEIMTDLTNQIELINTFKSETVEVLGKSYFVSNLCFEGKVDPTIVLERYKTKNKVQFNLEWFVENFKFVDLY
jgi:hypothetical protein